MSKTINIVLEKINEHMHNPDNKLWINKQLLNPIASYIENYLKPYFLTLIIFLFAIVLLLLYIVRLLFKLQNRIDS